MLGALLVLLLFMGSGFSSLVELNLALTGRLSVEPRPSIVSQIFRGPILWGFVILSAWAVGSAVRRRACWACIEDNCGSESFIKL